MGTKEFIRDVLTDELELTYRIVSVSKPKEEVDKKTFIEILEILEEINDRTEFMSTELGIDSVQYEDKFFQVIEGLMKIAFNKKQILLINMFTNDIAQMKEDWDGTITIEIENKEEVIKFKTPEDVWNAIQKFN